MLARLKFLKKIWVLWEIVWKIGFSQGKLAGSIEGRVFILNLVEGSEL